MEEYQECAGHLKAIVLGLRDDVKTGKVTAAAAQQRLASIHQRALMAQVEFQRIRQSARLAFGR